MEVSIERITLDYIESTGAELTATISELLYQLTESPREITRDVLEKIVGQEHTNLYVASIESRIVGMFSAATYEVPTRRVMIIEDVVVDRPYRRRGIGRQLTQYGILCAEAEQVDTIDLTSRDSRPEANAMYLSLGFVKRDTNYYRYEVKRNHHQ